MIGLSAVAVTGLISTIPDDKITEALTNEAFPLDENGKPDRAHPFYPRQSRDGEELQGFSAAASIRAAVTNAWFWEFCREVFPNNNIINTGRPGAPALPGLAAVPPLPLRRTPRHWDRQQEPELLQGRPAVE